MQIHNAQTNNNWFLTVLHSGHITRNCVCSEQAHTSNRHNEHAKINIGTYSYTGNTYTRERIALCDSIYFEYVRKVLLHTLTKCDAEPTPKLNRKTRVKQKNWGYWAEGYALPIRRIHFCFITPIHGDDWDLIVREWASKYALFDLFLVSFETVLPQTKLKWHNITKQSEVSDVPAGCKWWFT